MCILYIPHIHHRIHSYCMYKHYLIHLHIIYASSLYHLKIYHPKHTFALVSICFFQSIKRNSNTEKPNFRKPKKSVFIFFKF